MEAQHPTPPNSGVVIDATAFGMAGTPNHDSTVALQRAIDAAAAIGGGLVTVPPGTYLIGAIFLKSGVELRVQRGATLLGIQNTSAYPVTWTRIAGFELNWPCALINICGQSNVKLSGEGTIDGQGDYWWHRFWGSDCKSGMRADYEKRGLRWAADYDCERPRLIQIYKSSHISVDGLNLHNPGFWTVHVCFSEYVTCTRLTIRANLRGIGPSSDGIDIDSSREVLVDGCDIDCNDDNICLKAGRDADGLRVNIPTENVVIRNCVTRSGHGMITLGSETSGGFRNIEVSGLRAIGTRNGIRFKSARIRGGITQGVSFHDIIMEQVDEAFAFELNWFPAYSYPEIPPSIPESEIRPTWRAIVQRVAPPERGIPEFHHISFKNIEVRRSKLAFRVEAYPEKHLHDLFWDNIRIHATSAGHIVHASDWRMNDVHLVTDDGSTLRCNDCINVDLPKTTHPEGTCTAGNSVVNTAPSFVEDRNQER